MVKFKTLKKAFAAITGCATLFTCTTANFVSNTVTAADGENYAEALAMSLYFFDANYCGTEVDDNPLTWRGNCHTYDGQASLNNAKYLDESTKAAIKAANGGSDTVDVSGGYHDAGDHVKFNLTMGYAASSLALSYYMNPGAYAKADCEDHLQEILKNTCDYFKKTTFLDDSGKVFAVCATVSDQSDHGIWTSPEGQTIDRPTYWLTASRNNSVTTATMASAFAGSAYVFKDSDPAYSAECLEYAKALYDFASNHTGMEDTNSGMYSTTDTYIDDLALAQVWLYINGEGSLPTYKPTGNGCYNNQYYDYHLYCWDKVWSGYATVMYYITGDQAYASEMQFELGQKGGCPTNSYNASGWGASRYNCALQMVALGLAKGDASSDYAKGAKFQMDYILGNNQLNYSFLVGYGERWPQQLHHRAANPDKNNAKYTLYGALIGGPDSSGNYNDYYDDYQFTEPALDYNASFSLACAGLVNLYGGDASELDPIIANASEIDETYQFNGGSTTEQPTTEPTTEPTEPSTEPSTEETTEPVLGPVTHPCDVNDDSYVNAADAIALVKFLTKQDSNADYNYDANQDNKINVFDLTTVKRFVINGY